MASFNEWNEKTDDAAGESGGTGQVLHAEESDEQMPLGMSSEDLGDDLIGGGVGMEGAAFSASKKNINSGVLVLVVILAVGGGTLWTMRASSSSIVKEGGSISEAEAKIDQALAQLKRSAAATGGGAAAAELGELFSDTDRVIAMFADDPTEKQVNLDHLLKNPFELFIVPEAEDGEAMEAIDKARAQRLKELKRELGRLKLQSVLSGSTPVAVISGEVVRTGDRVGSFSVASISPYGVRLTAEGNTYTLTMEEKKNGSR